MQDVSAASRILGRGSASGSGDVEQLTLAATPRSSLTLTTLELAAVVPKVMASRAYTSATGPATGANTTETTLDSYTVPANLLSTDGDCLRIFVWGSTGANGNNKTMRIRFGTGSPPPVPVTLGPGAFNNQNWGFELVMVRVSSTETEIGGYTIVNALFPLTSPQGSLDFTVVNTLLITGQNGSSVANDIRLRGFRVTWEPTA